MTKRAAMPVILAVALVGGPAGVVVAQEAEPMASVAPAPSDAPASAASEARVIELTMDDFVTVRDPETKSRVSEIAVVPGETVTFRIDNIGDISHDFYVGSPEELEVENATTPVGIADWSEGVQELTWEVPEDIAELAWACTLHDHYFLMNGTFSSSS